MDNGAPIAAMMMHLLSGGGGNGAPMPRPRPPDVQMGMPEPARPRPWIDMHQKQQDDSQWSKSLGGTRSY